MDNEILLWIQKLESDGECDIAAESLVGSGLSCDSTTPLETNNSINLNLNCIDRPQPQKRSFFNKFEVDYMNPIFGGPDPVSEPNFMEFISHFTRALHGLQKQRLRHSLIILKCQINLIFLLYLS